MLMDLFIETLTGVSFELHVSPAETVMSIKSKIQRAEGIPVSQQHLIWQNGELDDHRRLRDYAISEGSTLRLVLGLRGGPLNAHRVPPLRLTPIQLAPSTPPNKFGSNSMNNNKHTHLSGVASDHSIPRSSLFPNDLRQNRNSFESTLISRMLSPLKKVVTNIHSDISCIKPSGNTKLEWSDEEVRDTSSGITLVKPTSKTDASHTESISSKSSKLPDSPTNEVCDNESQCDQKTTTKDECSECINVPKPISRDGKNELDLNSSSNPQKQDGCDQPEGRCSTSEYPPLLRSIDTYHPFYMQWDSREPPSSWRLCTGHGTGFSGVSKTLGQQSKANDDQPAPMATEVNSASVVENIPESGDNPDKSTDSISTTAAAATLLATLLAATADHSQPLPYQATRALGRLRYPYHWLRKPSPLPEENEGQNSFISNGFWDADDCEDDRDTVGANMYDAESDQDDEDPDEDENSDTKDGYCCSVDDDDSLADLEDYLFYYRTGDLLFGPPSISTCYAPYSCYAVRDSYGLGQWNTDLDRDLSGIRTSSTNDVDSNLQNETAWRQEYNQLTEKVKNLKTRMKNARARRLGRKQNNKTADGEISDGGVLKNENCSDFQKNCCNSDDKQDKLENSSDLPSSDVLNPTNLSASNLDKKQRQRRFGTVTPPDVKFLIQIPSNKSSPISYDSSHLPTLSHFNPSDREIKLQPDRSSQGTRISVIKTIICPSPNDSKLSPTTSRLPSTSSEHTVESRPPNSSSPELNSLTKLTLGPRICTSVRTFDDQITSRKIATADSKPSVPSSQFLPSLVASTSSGLMGTRLLASSEGRLRVNSRLATNSKTHEPKSDVDNTSSSTKTKSHPRTPPGTSGVSVCRKRCAVCLRRIGLVNSYSCRCGRNFCARHRYAEVHSCPFDYKSEARRYLMESNPVVTAPKLPKI